MVAKNMNIKYLLNQNFNYFLFFIKSLDVIIM